MLDVIQRTNDDKWLLVPRLVAGLPLTLAGLAHLVGITPVAPLVEAAGLPASDVAALAAPIAEVVGGMLLSFGWLTRVGGVLAVLTMGGAIAIHFMVPDDRWPQPASGAPGPEPLFPFLMAWAILGCALISTIRGGGLWSADRRQVASRAASHGGGLDSAPTPRVKGPKPSKQKSKGKNATPPADGESVW